jgi:hypothetical protein
MRLNILALSVTAVIVAASNAQARSDVLNLPIQDAMASVDYRSKIGDFKFVWGDKVSGESLGTTSTRKATSAVFKADQVACDWALLSALIAFKNKAVSVGGSSVQGIKSMATGAPYSSTTKYQCTVGFTNARVHLTGTIVK